MIQEIGDISRLYPGTPNFSNAIRLRSLQIGSSTEGYMNSNLTGVTLGNNRMLEFLYVQNLAYINSGLDLSNCQSLLYLDASGSSFTGYDFAVGGLLTEAYIEAPTALSMRNLYYLNDEDFHVISYNNLDTLRVENCGNIDTLAIVTSAPNLARVRLLDINWSIGETTILNNLLTIAGLNENGNNTPVSVLTGNVYVSGSIRNQELTEYAEAWSNLTVSYNPANLIEQYKITYVNDDADHTVLYEVYVDQGILPIDPVALDLIPTPTKASTAQYTYTFSGWDNITTPVVFERTVTATYTRDVRTYTISFYSREGELWERFTDVAYGSDITPTANPTWTEGEVNNIYHLFKGWDKCTGNIHGDMDVFALWDTGRIPEPGTDMSEMTPAQIYGIGQAGMQDNYWEIGDYFDFTLGQDFDFSNVQSIEIGKDVTLTGIKRDTFVSGGYYFDGEHAFTTNIKLFDENSPAFTMAIDFQFNLTNGGATLISCHEGDTAEGFRLYYNGNNPVVQWGDQSVVVGYRNMRDIVVIRHAKGSRYLQVYSSNGSNTTRYAPEVAKTVMLRSNTTQTTEPLTFGAINYPFGFNRYGKGTLHWCKIWLDDIGETNAYKLAQWVHEKYRMEYWGKGRYYYPNSNDVCKASFVGNSLLGHFNGRGYWHNSTNDNTGGWNLSLLREFLNDRVYKALPTVYQSLVREVTIRSTIGGASSVTDSSFDKIYLQSYREMGSTTTDNGYIEEIGTSADPIPLFPNNFSRAKFQGKIRAYSENEVAVYNCPQEPSLLYQIPIAPDSLWINTGDSSRILIFVSQEEIEQYDYTPSIIVDNEYAQGGWFSAYVYYWERSPSRTSTTLFLCVNYAGGNGSALGASASYAFPINFSF